MLRPEAMPASVVGLPVGETDTSCLGCFSRRIGLISICWILVVTSILNFFTWIESMTLLSGGALAIVVIVFLANIADGVVSGLLLLGIRDGMVRTRLNIWLIWDAVYTVLTFILVIVEISVLPITAGLGVLTGLQTVLLVGFRVYGLWAGWKFREDLMAAPPPATQHRPDMGAF